MCYPKDVCQADSCVLVGVHTDHIAAPPSVDTESRIMVITLTGLFVRVLVCGRLVSPPSARKQVTKISTTAGYKYDDTRWATLCLFVWAVTFAMSISKEVLVCWYNTECVFAARMGHLIILNPHVSFRHTIYFKLLKILHKQIKKSSHVITGTFGYADL